MKRFALLLALLSGVLPAALFADAVVTGVSGTVLVFLPGSSEGVLISEGDTIPSGARIVTDAGESVTLTSVAGVTTTINSNSVIVYTDSVDAAGTVVASSIQVDEGSVTSDVEDPGVDYSVTSVGANVDADSVGQFTVSVTATNTVVDTVAAATVVVTNNFTGTQTVVNSATQAGTTFVVSPPASSTSDTPVVVVDDNQQPEVSPF